MLHVLGEYQSGRVNTTILLTCKNCQEKKIQINAVQVHRQNRVMI